MNVSILAGVLTFLLVVYSSGVQAQGNKDVEPVRLALETSRTATKALSVTVRTMLARHLAAGGPVGAIPICADSAQLVGDRIQQQHGLSIRRVSQKWRNARDIPDSFETAQLAKLSALHAGGALIDTLELFGVVVEDSVRVFRYMKPILVGELCLSCHGERATMKDLVNDAIRVRYPDDKAVGYKAGDLRGAVSVRIRMQ
jgi:hypothetical protein